MSALPALSRHAKNFSFQMWARAPRVVRPPKFGIVPKAYGVPPQSFSRSVTAAKRSETPSTISMRFLSIASMSAGSGLASQPRITHVAPGCAFWRAFSTPRAASGTGTSPAVPPSCSRSILKCPAAPNRSR